MAQRVGQHFGGYVVYFEGISYNCPALKLYGYTTEHKLVNAMAKAIDRRKAELAQRRGNWAALGVQSD